MLRQRLHYVPDTHTESNFDDVFLHSIDGNDGNDYIEKPGCMPPFITRILNWLSFWKKKEANRPKSICDIDDLV
jgi:hypothetical protein